MKKYKTIKILFSFLIISLVSCEKKLDEVVPQNALSEKLIIEDPNAARALHTGSYSNLRQYTYTLFQLGEMRSEIWADGVHTEGADANLRNLHTHNINVQTVPAGNFGGFHGLLYRLNTEIKLLPQTRLPEAEQNQFMAEILGLRAYIYYTMLKTWGGVPLTIEPIGSIGNLEDLYKERSSPEDILAQIKEDIEQSLVLFAGNNALSPKRVYWNRIATLALKGDVYLWSGTLMDGGQIDLNSAKVALEEITALEGSSLDLNANYADTFDPAKKATNKEMIFAINYEQDQVENTVFNSSFLVNLAELSSRLDNSNGATVQSVYPLAVGGNKVGMSTSTLQKLSTGSDSRINASFRPIYNAGNSNHKGVVLTKYIGEMVSGVRVYDVDFPVYRYADVLLMLAEAKAKLLLSPSEEINKIRKRAYGNGYTPYVSSTLDTNMEAILEEQLREFIGEGKRWWALRRAGDEWVLNYIDPRFLTEATKYKFLLPITRAQLESDPKLTQTPGYEN